MFKIISIVGQTATGKTETALALAEFLLSEKASLLVGGSSPLVSGVDLISADSRQVYQGLEITSGADIPDDWVLRQAENLPFQFFEKPTHEPNDIDLNGLSDINLDEPSDIRPDSLGKIRLHGVSILQPGQEWSVGQFGRLVKSVVEFAEQAGRVVILVGGTGLYHQSALKDDWQLQVPPDPEVRAKAEKLSTPELQEWVKKVSFIDFQKLNQSDRANPRRLVRVLEKFWFKNTSKQKLDHSHLQDLVDMDSPKLNQPHQQIYFGLQSAQSITIDKIKKRVELRISQGALNEVKSFLSVQRKISQPVNNQFMLQAASTLGVEQIDLLLKEKITKAECITAWARAEISYAKRQQTWWKNKKFVQWIDQSNEDWLYQLKTMVLREFFGYNQK